MNRVRTGTRKLGKDSCGQGFLLALRDAKRKKNKERKEKRREEKMKPNRKRYLKERITGKRKTTNQSLHRLECYDEHHHITTTLRRQIECR